MVRASLEELVSHYPRVERQPGQHPGRALFDIPAIKQHIVPLTVDQYHVLIQQEAIAENVELIEGIVVEKMPKSPLHSFLVVILLEWLRRAVGDDKHVRSEQPITCLHSEPEPDLAVVRGHPRDYLSTHPRTADLIVEIAVSSAEIDRRKALVYAAADVKEYWIVLPDKCQIEAHSGLVDGQYTVRRIFREDQAVRAESLPSFEVKLHELFRV